MSESCHYIIVQSNREKQQDDFLTVAGSQELRPTSQVVKKLTRNVREGGARFFFFNMLQGGNKQAR